MFSSALKFLIPYLLVLGLVIGLFYLVVKYGLTFFRAIPYFVVDCFKKAYKKAHGEEDIFNLYGVYLYNGLGGNGKTISMVRRARELKRRFPRLLVIANFHTSVADKMFDSWQDILNAENIDDKGVNHGVLILFDEMHLTLNSQSWQDAPSTLLEYISLQRHVHKCIFGSAQEWSRVSKIIREQVNYIVDCKALFGGRYIQNKVYTHENYIINGESKDAGTRARPCEYKESFIATDELRALYDTHEIVKGLKISEQTSTDKALQRIAQALNEQTSA